MSSTAMTVARQRMTVLHTAMEKGRDQLVRLVGGDATKAERLINSAMIHAASNDKVMACEPRSIFRAVCQAAACDADLTAGRGEGYIIPFKNQATFMDGYKLWKRKINEAGYQLVTETVCEGDDFVFRRAPLELQHSFDAFVDRGQPRGAYAAAYRVGADGQHVLVAAHVLGSVELNKARDGAKARNYGKESPAWKDWADRMYYRLPIKRLAADLDLRESPGLQKLLELDATTDMGVDPDVDGPQDLTPTAAGDLSPGRHSSFGFDAFSESEPEVTHTDDGVSLEPTPDAPAEQNWDHVGPPPMREPGEEG